jgi:D-alanyl-lipoteichoic acid acyltransferase DltB (MBOAT superfamily)
LESQLACRQSPRGTSALLTSNVQANNSKKKQLDPSNLSERDRVTIPAKNSDFSFRNYFAYAMYSPLYLAGPIVTFNDWISQQRYRPHSITTKRTTMYAIRFIVVLLTMEIMCHYLYMVAIFHAKPDWSQYTPAQLSMMGFFNLKHIWLKLLIPWRFFRLWALLDGIDPPENMVRCMSDNYSVMQFWRGWHRSFNKWSLRYLYIPLGGSAGKGAWGKARAVFSSLVVFTFIAIWHDIQLRLLMWGWLVTLFVLPEILASYIFPARRWKNSPDAYRWLCGVGAVGEILMLMTANLVGFALGLDGLEGLVKSILGTWDGQVFFWTACFALFTGAEFMFEWRESEKRRGIKMKC